MNWDLQANHHAVVLSTTAPYDTLRLAATPRNARGEPLRVDEVARYVSRDPQKVMVLSDGLLRAIAPTSSPALVIVSMIVGYARRVDSVYVKVVDKAAPPVLASFSAHPVPPDSAKASAHAGGYHFGAPLPVRALDAKGTPIPDALVWFRTSDTTTATIGTLTGEIAGRRPGNVTFYASTTMFGVTKADTVPYRIGWPLTENVILGPSGDSSAVQFSPAEIRLGVGAYVRWISSLDNQDSLAVTFTGPAPPASPSGVGFLPFPPCRNPAVNCDAGNFVLGGVGNQQPHAARSFLVPGVYEYRGANGVGGRVIVVDER